VDDVQIDLINAQPPQALLRLGGRIATRGIELGRYEHVLARDAAVGERAADALLVPVGLRGVDVPVAELERPANGVLGLRPVGDLPHAQADDWHLVSV
jgi:hypothetical protein